MNLREFHAINDYVAVVLSIILNSTLTFLVATESNKVVKSYRKMLILQSCNEFFYTFVCIITQAQMHVHHGVLALTLNSPLTRWLPLDWHYYLLFLYILSLGVGAIKVPIDYFYRYFLVCRGHVMTFGQLLFLTALCYAYAVLDAVEWLKANLNDRPNLQSFEFAFNDTMWFENGKLVKFVATDSTNLWIKMLIFTGTSAVVGTYSLVAILCVLTIRALDAKKRLMSGPTMRMQRNMTKMMYMQAVLPLFSVFLPLFTVFTILTLRLDTPRAGLWITIFLAWVPLTGPVSVIIFIRPFNVRLRNALMGRAMVRHLSGNSTSEGATNAKLGVSAATSSGVKVSALTVR